MEKAIWRALRESKKRSETTGILSDISALQQKVRPLNLQLDIKSPRFKPLL